jgi:ribosomal 30S subunit maturation factor RimM
MNPASGGKTQLLPFDDVHVPTVDIAAGKIVVVPPIEQE